MTTKTRRRYTTEFKTAAVARLDEPGETLSSVAPTPLGRNPQGLTGIDQVGVLEHRPVGLEDPHVSVGVAVELAGDLRQGVAASYRVEAGFPLSLPAFRVLGRRGGGDQDRVIDIADALDVAHGQDDLLLLLLAGRLAPDRDRVVLDAHVVGVAVVAEFGDFLLQG